MPEDRFARLRQLLRKLEERYPALELADTDKAREVIVDRRMQTLLNLADDEAVEYLRAVDESTLVEDYFFLSKRLSADALRALCREFLRRPAFRARLLGITQLGTILQGSCSREESIELARVVRNPSEDEGIRGCAYDSLKLINVGNTSQLLEYLESSLGLPSTASQRIDWDFVDSFLRAN